MFPTFMPVTERNYSSCGNTKKPDCYLLKHVPAPWLEQGKGDLCGTDIYRI